MFSVFASLDDTRDNQSRRDEGRVIDEFDRLKVPIELSRYVDITVAKRETLTELRLNASGGRGFDV